MTLPAARCPSHPLQYRSFKPHPDIYLHAASTMGAKPSRCVVVEDNPSGVTAAVSAGMRAIGYVADSDETALSWLLGLG